MLVNKTSKISNFMKYIIPEPAVELWASLQ